MNNPNQQNNNNNNNNNNNINSNNAAAAAALPHQIPNDNHASSSNITNNDNNNNNNQHHHQSLNSHNNKSINSGVNSIPLRRDSTGSMMSSDGDGGTTISDASFRSRLLLHQQQQHNNANDDDEASTVDDATFFEKQLQNQDLHINHQRNQEMMRMIDVDDVDYNDLFGSDLLDDDDSDDSFDDDNDNDINNNNNINHHRHHGPVVEGGLLSRSFTNESTGLLLDVNHNTDEKSGTNNTGNQKNNKGENHENNNNNHNNDDQLINDDDTNSSCANDSLGSLQDFLDDDDEGDDLRPRGRKRLLLSPSKNSANNSKSHNGGSPAKGSSSNVNNNIASGSSALKNDDISTNERTSSHGYGESFRTNLESSEQLQQSTSSQNIHTNSSGIPVIVHHQDDRRDEKNQEKGNPSSVVKFVDETNEVQMSNEKNDNKHKKNTTAGERTKPLHNNNNNNNNNNKTDEPLSQHERNVARYGNHPMILPCFQHFFFHSLFRDEDSFADFVRKTTIASLVSATPVLALIFVWWIISGALEILPGGEQESFASILIGCLGLCITIPLFWLSFAFVKKTKRIPQWLLVTLYYIMSCNQLVFSCFYAYNPTENWHFIMSAMYLVVLQDSSQQRALWLTLANDEAFVDVDVDDQEDNLTIAETMSRATFAAPNNDNENQSSSSLLKRRKNNTKRQMMTSLNNSNSRNANGISNASSNALFTASPSSLNNNSSKHLGLGNDDDDDYDNNNDDSDNDDNDEQNLSQIQQQQKSQAAKVPTYLEKNRNNTTKVSSPRASSKHKRSNSISSFNTDFALSSTYSVSGTQYDFSNSSSSRYAAKKDKRPSWIHIVLTSIIYLIYCYNRHFASTPPYVLKEIEDSLSYNNITTTSNITLYHPTTERRSVLVYKNQRSGFPWENLVNDILVIITLIGTCFAWDSVYSQAARIQSQSSKFPSFFRSVVKALNSFDLEEVRRVLKEYSLLPNSNRLLVKGVVKMYSALSLYSSFVPEHVFKAMKHHRKLKELRSKFGFQEEILNYCEQQQKESKKNKHGKDEHHHENNNNNNNNNNNSVPSAAAAAAAASDNNNNMMTKTDNDDRHVSGMIDDVVDNYSDEEEQYYDAETRRKRLRLQSLVTSPPPRLQRIDKVTTLFIRVLDIDYHSDFINYHYSQIIHSNTNNKKPINKTNTITANDSNNHNSRISNNTTNSSSRKQQSIHNDQQKMFGKTNFALTKEEARTKRKLFSALVSRFLTVVQRRVEQHFGTVLEAGEYNGELVIAFCTRSYRQDLQNIYNSKNTNNTNKKKGNDDPNTTTTTTTTDETNHSSSDDDNDKKNNNASATNERLALKLDQANDCVLAACSALHILSSCREIFEPEFKSLLTSFVLVEEEEEETSLNQNQKNEDNDSKNSNKRKSSSSSSTTMKIHHHHGGGPKPFQIRMGIHQGDATLGMTGSESCSSFCMFGESVSCAKSFTFLEKVFQKCNIVVSSEVVKSLSFHRTQMEIFATEQMNEYYRQRAAKRQQQQQQNEGNGNESNKKSVAPTKSLLSSLFSRLPVDGDNTTVSRTIKENENFNIQQQLRKKLSRLPYDLMFVTRDLSLGRVKQFDDWSSGLHQLIGLHSKSRNRGGVFVNNNNNNNDNHHSNSDGGGMLLMQQHRTHNQGNNNNAPTYLEDSLADIQSAEDLLLYRQKQKNKRQWYKNARKLQQQRQFGVPVSAQDSLVTASDTSAFGMNDSNVRDLFQDDDPSSSASSRQDGNNTNTTNGILSSSAVSSENLLGQGRGTIPRDASLSSSRSSFSSPNSSADSSHHNNYHQQQQQQKRGGGEVSSGEMALRNKLSEEFRQVQERITRQQESVYQTPIDSVTNNNNNNKTDESATKVEGIVKIADESAHYQQQQSDQTIQPSAASDNNNRTSNDDENKTQQKNKKPIMTEAELKRQLEQKKKSIIKYLAEPCPFFTNDKRVVAGEIEYTLLSLSPNIYFYDSSNNENKDEDENPTTTSLQSQENNNNKKRQKSGNSSNNNAKANSSNSIKNKNKKRIDYVEMKKILTEMMLEKRAKLSSKEKQGQEEGQEEVSSISNPHHHHEQKNNIENKLHIDDDYYISEKQLQEEEDDFELMLSNLLDDHYRQEKYNHHDDISLIIGRSLKKLRHQFLLSIPSYEIIRALNSAYRKSMMHRNYKKAIMVIDDLVLTNNLLDHQQWDPILVESGVVPDVAVRLKNKCLYFLHYPPPVGLFEAVELSDCV